MNESLHDGPESYDGEQELDSDKVSLAVNGLSRVVDERNDYEDSYDDDYDDDDDEYEDEYDYDYDDDYYDDYEEEHYGDERIEFNEDNLTLQEIPLPDKIIKLYPFINELPHGIAVMGGVARSIAREIITGDREPIRDIDLVNIVNEEGRSELDYDTLDALSQEYMPDDYAFGHGIGNDNLDHYFRSRDFTINQCLIKDGKLIISNFAYNDFQENIIRPTYYEHPYDGDDVESRLFLKALMLRIVVEQISTSIPLIEDMGEPNYIGTFDITLFLNKAMSRGAETARTFTVDLADWNVIDEKYAGRPLALAKSLIGNLYSFEFRPSTDERFEDIQEFKDMSGYFVPPAMTRFYSSDPAIRRAIAEYEDGKYRMEHRDGERLFGRYTQKEYDEINRLSTDGDY